MLRNIINNLYSRARGLDAAVDSNVSNGYLAREVGGKITQKIRSVRRGFPAAYIGPQVRIRGGAQLKLGKSVVLAHGVLINALSLEGVRIGARSTIDEYAVLRGSGVIRNIGVGISVGSRTAIGARNIILGQGGVYIGNDCLLGPNVTIVSENHNISDPETPIRAQGETRASIHIDDDVWIGAGATILAGAKLGKGVVVAAGAVVRGNIDEMTIVGGVPAKLIGSRRASDAPVA